MKKEQIMSKFCQCFFFSMGAIKAISIIKWADSGGGGGGGQKEEKK